MATRPNIFPMATGFSRTGGGPAGFFEASPKLPLPFGPSMLNPCVRLLPKVILEPLLEDVDRLREGGTGLLALSPLLVLAGDFGVLGFLAFGAPPLGSLGGGVAYNSISPEMS